VLAKCFGEFMGTLVLILLGDGVVANVLLKWVAPPVTRSILLATLGHASPTPCCPLLARVLLIWGYAIVPVLGPIIGGGLAGMLLRTIVK